MLGLLPSEYWEYKFSDIIRGLAAALGPRKPRGMLYIDGLGSCITARSARAALVVSLRALGLPAGARIGVPLYCCPVVFKAIKEAGCTACFIDVEHADILHVRGRLTCKAFPTRRRHRRAHVRKYM